MKAEFAQNCADFQAIPFNGARCFLFSTAAVEAAIANDGLSKPRSYGVRYIADAILRQRLGVTRIAGRRNKPCHLHSQLLKAAIGNCYREPLNWLTRQGLLETDRHYTVGESARAYAITRRGWRGGLVPVAMTALQVGRYAKARARLKKQSEAARNAEGVPLDYLHLHLGRLSFEADGVKLYFEALRSPKNWKEWERNCSNAYAASLVAGHDWTFHRCAAGRLHYPLTNLPKALRKLLRYQGEELRGIDVSSCQPFLAASLYRGEGEEERRRYMADVKGKGFYERLGTVAGWRGSRDDLKREVLKCVFFGAEEQASGSIWEAFEALYPVLAGTIFEGKRELRPWSGDRELALRLQGAEAGVFINGALRRIAEEMPGVPALPLHDCLLTVADKVEEVLTVLREEFLRQFGEVPSFSFEAA